MRSGRSAAAVLCGLGIAGLAAAGCTATADAPSPAAGATSPASASHPSSPATRPSPAVSYRPVNALCTRLDLRTVADLVGQVGAPQGRSRTSGNSANLACAVTVGRLPDGVVVTVRADIGAPDSGRLMYEGLRQAQEASGPVTELTGLGAAAYTYTDKATGVTVVTYDANLYLTLTATPLRLGADLPGDLTAGLSAAAASALTALRA
ncbi:hypothetical protein ABZ570_13755 [Micromonospora sp. NPDC007271]|uniref:hypothetical protein n=1 Tax=Micromonospora sp. NPDC007271 TaxID=3154587 RepID=UPI0033C0B76B